MPPSSGSVVVFTTFPARPSNLSIPPLSTLPSTYCTTPFTPSTHPSVLEPATTLKTTKPQNAKEAVADHSKRKSNAKASSTPHMFGELSLPPQSGQRAHGCTHVPSASGIPSTTCGGCSRLVTHSGCCSSRVG
ncbi:hypothetical protein BKA80DRAFT_262004 [Phyllosticta citrichinensis]